ncbi:hypothetical protein D3C78_1866190 [compost metagenome]
MVVIRVAKLRRRGEVLIWELRIEWSSVVGSLYADVAVPEALDAAHLGLTEPHDFVDRFAADHRHPPNESIDLLERDRIQTHLSIQ